jgi:hypothetical protein
LRREFQELAKQVPKEEWDKLPADLLDNLDHYLYGTPKKPPRAILGQWTWRGPRATATNDRHFAQEGFVPLV